MDKKQLEKLFAHCNEKYFDGKLPTPELRVSHAKTRLGTMSYRRTARNANGFFGVLKSGKRRPSDFRISISDYYVMTDDQIEDVMIHEMIHYSIAYTGIKDTAPHGIVFRGMMDAINRKYGRNISVMTATKGWRPRIAPKEENFLVLGLQMCDGTYFLSSVNPSFAGRLELQINRLREVKAHKWIRTNDDFFRSFPRVRSLRGRRVTKNVYYSKIGT